jgi:exosortase A
MAARTKLWVPILLAAGFAVLYQEVLSSLVRDWAIDDNYSHGFLVAPLVAYFVWERRQKLAGLPLAPSWAGLLILVGSLVVLVAGTLGAELFLTRVAMIGTLTGGVVFILGWRHLKQLAFPMAFTLLMIPMPAIIFNQIAFPLQLIASRVGEATLSLCNIPVLREGNLIVLANTTLEVAEACSGIRSLISLLTLGIVYGYFADARTGMRVAIALTTVPVAIAANGLRVAGTGIAATYFGKEAATGFFHNFSGWLVFLVSFAMLFAVIRAISWAFPSTPDRRVSPMAAAELGAQR